MLGVVIAAEMVFGFVFMLALGVPCCKFIAKAFTLLVAFPVVVTFLFQRLSNPY